MRSLTLMCSDGKLWLAGSRLMRATVLLPNIWVYRSKRWVAREDFPEPLAPRRKIAFIVVEKLKVIFTERQGRKVRKEFCI